MKKLKNAILIAVLAIAMFGCNCGCDYKYTIRTEKCVYQTNEIEYVGDCIEFTDWNENPVKVCGNYAIEENKNYKPKKNKNR